MCLGRLLHAKGAIDDRSNAAALEQREHREPERSHEPSFFVNGAVAQCRSEQHESLPEQQAHIQLSAAPPGESDDDDASLRRGRDEIPLEVAAADEVANDVRPVRHLVPRRKRPRHRNRMNETLAHQSFQLGGGARGTGGDGPPSPSQVQEGDTNATRDRVNQHVLAFACSHLLEGIERREVGFGHCRRLFKRPAVRNGNELRTRHRDELRVCATGEQGHHAIAGLPFSHIAPDGLDDARRFQAWDIGRHAGRRRIATQSLEDIGTVHTGSGYPEQHLVSRRNGRGHGGQLQRVRAAGSRDTDCAHGRKVGTETVARQRECILRAMPHRGSSPPPPLIAPEVDSAALFQAVQREFVGTFEILELVAASTARCLFVARDVVLKRHVGLRVHVQPDAPSRRWFERESELLAKLDHSALRAVLAAGYRNEWAYRIVKWIEGESLADAVARGARPIPTVLQLARNLASVLDYLHTLGIVIRRLAPPTIMIDNSERAHLIDLRYANVLLEVASPASEPVQEPFIAPEIRGGDPGDPSCDVYSAAALLYFAVTGTAPDLEPERVANPRSIREACPMALERVIMRGLRRDPTDRFLTAIEMVEDLLTDLGDFDVQSPLASERTAPQTDDPGSWEKRLRRALGDEYELLEELGAGGFGRVYRVRDLALERQVALKVLHQHLVIDPEVVERFRREARLAAQLVHPYIANTYDIGQRGGLLWYTMEYVRGRNLARTVQAGGPLPPERVVRVLRETLSALEYAHAFGLVHRDLKPENILIDKATGNVRIVDFGLAIGLRGKEASGRTTSQSGTPDFAAPEQLLGEHVDHRSDLYSLSLVGLYGLTGRLPFGSGTLETTLALRATGDPPALADLRGRVSGPLLRVLARGAASDPADRFQSATEYREALRAATPKGASALAGLWRKITGGK